MNTLWPITEATRGRTRRCPIVTPRECPGPKINKSGKIPNV
jgi:hypothetical protein